MANSAPSYPPSDDLQPPPKPTEESWADAAKTIGLSVLLAVGIRTFIAEPRYIPSESMLPTLRINDRLIIDKVTYHFKPLERGDIIVFHPPESSGQEYAREAFIKRIIGLPGEMVEVRNSRVYVNGVPLTENYLEAAPDYQWGPQVVPENSYLVLGDNRNDSYDGHYWGFVPRDRIIGRASVRFWPLNRLGGLHHPAYAQP